MARRWLVSALVSGVALLAAIGFAKFMWGEVRLRAALSIAVVDGLIVFLVLPLGKR